MLKKVRIILAFMALSICLCLMSNTYSRYIASTTGNVEALFAKWQILVSDVDITNGTSTEIEFTPIFENNEYVAENVIAPSSKGYFDIAINPSNVDVSFSYTINLNLDNEMMQDIKITSFAVLPKDYVEDGEEELTITPIENNIITNTLFYDNENEEFQFESFTIRVFFEWYEGEDEVMDDEADTQIGYMAATENLTLAMSANISFEQVLE